LRPAGARSARASASAVFVGATLVACGVGDLDLSGKKCPCASGYTCDVTQNLCVPNDAAAVPCGPPATSFGGHCYYLVTQPLSFDAALAACSADGPRTHLVSITSVDEERVAESIDANQNRWIGMQRPLGSPVVKSSYKWTTGEPTTFDGWVGIEPSDPDPDVCVRLGSDNQWHTGPCTDAWAALCERD
jgi:hypothetical protein